MSAPDDTHTEARPSLFERLRSLFGMGHGTVREDIADALEQPSDDSDFTQQERVLLKNVLSLHELRVSDVMVPRADIIAIEINTTLNALLTVFRTAGHSRLPVYSETLDDARGMVHIRDFVDYVARSAEKERPMQMQANTPELGPRDLARFARTTGLDLTRRLADANILRPVLFVPPSMPVLDLLVKMQAMRTHMALVVDEYGGTDGLASIEDVVEMIVGNIEDEHDFEQAPRIEATADGNFLVDARANLEDVAAALGRDVATPATLEDIDTIGGLVTAIAGHVPTRGEIVPMESGLEAEVIDADPRRVKRLRLRRTAVEQPTDVSAIV